MSYLKNNNNKVVVDAILTDYGKAKLASKGTLDIYKFAVADDEIDYTLYNSDHPDGTDYYNSAIVNLPLLQSLPDFKKSMKYPLFTPSSSYNPVVEELSLTYDANLSGIQTYKYYSITPSILPVPGDITQIYYIATLKRAGVSTGDVLELKGVINDDIGITQGISNSRQSMPSVNAVNIAYAVGHWFQFRVITANSSNGSFYTLHIHPVNVNARDKYITIGVGPKSLFPSQL